MRLILVRHCDIILDIESCSNTLLITKINYFYNYLGYIPYSVFSSQRFPSIVTSIFLYRSIFFAFSSFQWFNQLFQWIKSLQCLLIILLRKWHKLNIYSTSLTVMLLYMQFYLTVLCEVDVFFILVRFLHRKELHCLQSG